MKTAYGETMDSFNGDGRFTLRYLSGANKTRVPLLFLGNNLGVLSNHLQVAAILLGRRNLHRIDSALQGVSNLLSEVAASLQSLGHDGWLYQSGKWERWQDG
jgi:hypothetical protein